jgi:hypothetical protein
MMREPKRLAPLTLPGIRAATGRGQTKRYSRKVECLTPALRNGRGVPQTFTARKLRTTPAPCGRFQRARDAYFPREP